MSRDSEDYADRLACLLEAVKAWEKSALKKVDMRALYRYAQHMPSPQERLLKFAEFLHEIGLFWQVSAITRYLAGEFKSLDEAFGLRHHGQPGRKRSKQNLRKAAEIHRLRQQKTSWRVIADKVNLDAGTARRLYKELRPQLILDEYRQALGNSVGRKS